EPGERFTPEIETATVGRPCVLQERPNSILQHREEQSALTARRLGTPINRLVADADFAVESGQIHDRVARMTEGGAAARGRRRGTRCCRLWNRMLSCLARHHDRGPARSLGRHGAGHGPCIFRWQSVKSLIFRTKMAGEVSAELHLSHAGG